MCEILYAESYWYILSFSEPWRAMWVTYTNVVSSHLVWWCCLAVQLKIWSDETGQCPVTLRGHTAAVTDMCIADKGRNIISLSK